MEKNKGKLFEVHHQKAGAGSMLASQSAVSLLRHQGSYPLMIEQVL